MKPLQLEGEKFGRLTVLNRAGSTKQGVSLWLCKCDCGAMFIAHSQRLKSGQTKSCGCLNKELIIARDISRRKKKDSPLNSYRLYRIYNGMKSRCYNPQDHRAKYYHNLGIQVCKEWLDSFEAFEAWSLSHGYAEDLSIDRINPFGNYEPNNCRWATAKEQANNRRSNREVH
jgi:hypothetical protein